MTDLTQAIAKLRRVNLTLSAKGWTGGAVQQTDLDDEADAIATILNAVASGDLIPLAEVQALRAERDGLLSAAHDNHEADKRAESAEAELSTTQDKLTRMSREFADFMRRHGPQDEFTQSAVAAL